MTQTIRESISQWGNRQRPTRARIYIALTACAAIVLVTAVVVAATRPPRVTGPNSSQPVRYLGVYEPGAPGSYSGIDEFAQAIGRQPNMVLYYSPWLGPFRTDFASLAARHGAVTLAQIGTGRTSLASIATGSYDSYWRSYADEVKAFGGPVILSLDHEMNGDWESWGYKHESPEAFVAAWRHVVTVFRERGARNVTWLWTVNIVDPGGSEVGVPARWWPGNSYVNWVGIDGYYYGWSQTFPALFGPTIANVRGFTRAPILIAETGASLSADQPAKIADLFNGVRAFGLLGFVLFDQDGVFKAQSWRIDTRDAFAALRQSAKAYMKPSPASRTDP